MKRLFHHLLLFCLVAASAVAQNSGPVGRWGPVGNTPVHHGQFATVADGFLYVIHYNGSSPQGSGLYGISRWDGASWEHVTEFTFDGAIFAFTAYRGELYVAGAGFEFNGIPEITGIARWDGSQWHPLEAGADGGLQIVERSNTYAMTRFRDVLVIAGMFREAGGEMEQGVVQWDGTQWQRLQADAALDMNVGVLIADGDRLYAGGNSVFEWDGTGWTDIAADIRDSRKHRFHQLAAYQGDLYAVSSFDVYRRQENRWRKIKSGTWTVQPCPSLAVHNGALFFSGSFIYDELEGYTQTPRQWDGVRWRDLPSFNHFITFLIEYKGVLYAGGQFTQSQLTPLPGIARFYNQENLAEINGTIFHDADGNCTPAPGEQGHAGRIIEILPGPFYTVTGEQGKYTCLVPPGDYTVAPVPALYWNSSCSRDEYSVELQEPGSIASGKDFPITPELDIQAVRASITSTRARPGFQLGYTITYRNIGTLPASGTLRFFHDPILTFKSAAPASVRYSAGVAEWDFTGLPVGASHSVQVNMEIPRRTALNMRLCALADVNLPATPVPGPGSSDSSCVNVSGSFDPNDIQVTPDGLNGNGILATTDSVLTYTIRFQNTGTDTAFTVVVVDTLAAGHAPASIMLGATSHPCTFALTGSGVLTWTFANILLPDSNINEPASHGYLKYSIRLRPGLPPGTEIPNRASIYFDFNDPVITNTVVSILPRASSVGITESDVAAHRIYPNPSRGPVIIHTSAPEGSVIEVQNMLGRQVLLHRVTGNTGEVKLDLSSLPAGTYTVLVPSEDGAGVAGKVVLVR